MYSCIIFVPGIISHLKTPICVPLLSNTHARSLFWFIFIGCGRCGSQHSCSQKSGKLLAKLHYRVFPNIFTSAVEPGISTYDKTMKMQLLLVKRETAFFTKDYILDESQVQLVRKLSSVGIKRFLLPAGWLLIATWKQLKNWLGGLES